jgi:hypothetical protein
MSAASRIPEDVVKHIEDFIDKPPMTAAEMRREASVRKYDSLPPSSKKHVHAIVNTLRKYEGTSVWARLSNHELCCLMCFGYIGPEANDKDGEINPRFFVHAPDDGISRPYKTSCRCHGYI